MIIRKILKFLDDFWKYIEIEEKGNLHIERGLW